MRLDLRPGLGSFPTIQRLVGAGEGAAPAPVTAVIYGQSEMEYLLNRDAFYRAIPQPTPGDGNLILFQQKTDGSDHATDVPPLRTEVNAASVAAGLVNPAIAALSAFLAFARPGRQFVIGDGAVPGTGRIALHDGSEANRRWSDFVAVVDAIEAEFGPLGHLIECWYNSDASFINNFQNAFWPSYFGTLANGSSFTLGGTNAVTGAVVANCLWDGTAATNAKGRGIFARSQTLWHILTPMPFLDAPVSPSAEMINFSESGGRLSEPSRAVLHGLTSDGLAQSVGLRVGPSAHLCKFGGASSEIHPDVANPDGQILLMWPIAMALLRASGMTVEEPEIVATEGPTDGSYADLVISLPNGGNLTTLSALEGRAAYAGSAPHQQAVTGVEVSRSGGQRRPVYRTSETSYPASHRGTVTIVDTGSGTPRRGRVRITPTTPFAFGDALSYLRGQATASLVEPRDFDLYPYFLIEHIPALHDSGATYPFPGVAVKPYQQDVAVQVPAPAFTARAARFDGTDYYAGSGLSIAGGAQGMASFWLRHTGAWAAGSTLLDLRVGSTTQLQVVTASSGRITFRLNQDGTGSDVFGTPTSTFVGDTWYHVLWAWNYAASRFQIYVNGVALNTAAYSFAGSTKFAIAGDTITQLGLGALSSGSGIISADVGHLWLSVNQTLDLSVQANREKFALAGQPVDLGGNGQTPTGTAPEWYYDGTAPAWDNQGTAGSIALTGALTAGGAPGY